MPAGRPAKPMFPATPLDEAFDDLDQGALSYEAASEFTSLCRDVLREAVAEGQIETFHYGRRVLLVKKSVRMWLAKKLAKERQDRERRELVGR